VTSDPTHREIVDIAMLASSNSKFWLSGKTEQTEFKSNYLIKTYYDRKQWRIQFCSKGNCLGAGVDILH
jgi:hypothetical protein